MCCVVHLKLSGSDALESGLCPCPGWQPSAELFSSSWFRLDPEGYCNLVFRSDFLFSLSHSLSLALFALQSIARLIAQSCGNQQQCVIQGLITGSGRVQGKGCAPCKIAT